MPLDSSNLKKIRIKSDVEVFVTDNCDVEETAKRYFEDHYEKFVEVKEVEEIEEN